MILLQINPDANNELFFTYSVEWKESAISWASRWDTYLSMSDVQIHWFSIINSLVVVFFLSGILTMIMIRTLRRDIARYNTDDNYEDTLEETGWKLVHGDVSNIANDFYCFTNFHSIIFDRYFDRQRIQDYSQLLLVVAFKYSSWH